MEREEEWLFDDPPDVAVFTSRQIITDRQPILYVTHDEADGAWQFHAGGEVLEEDARIVSLYYIVKQRDTTIEQLADLPLGWVAYRNSVGERWQRQPLEYNPASNHS